jgi:exopolysaccharide production protein ExoQ
MAVVCISSFIAIFAYPQFGIHNPGNTTNPEHYGAWRGMSGHKNDFGRLLALSCNIFLIGFLTRTSRRWIYLAFALFSILLIGGSRSGQAVVLVVLPPITLVMLLWLRRMSLQIRSLVILVAIPIGIFLSLLSNVIITEVLNILGKDPTLTGRSEIWSAVIASLGHHILLGGGYGTGWELVAEGVFLRIGGTMTHAHNGYLDLVLDVGIVGASITLAFYALIGLKLGRHLLSPQRTEDVFLGLVALIFIVAGNWVASFLLQYNSIYWVIPVIMYVKFSRELPSPVQASDPRVNQGNMRFSSGLLRN